jgi:hypothetical protein
MVINKEYYFDDVEHVQKNRTKKKQIILLNTSCEKDDYFKKIKTRYNGKYNRLPCFFISRTGEVYQHFNPIYYSKLMEGHQIEKHSITIALENVGWLFNDTLNNKVLTWSGSEYSGEIIEIPWRNKKYWATYTDEQYTKLAEIIDYLCIKHNIIKDFIGNNVVINKANNYRGVLNRSNYSKNYYDLSPAMDFKKLNELINKEYEHEL